MQMLFKLVCIFLVICEYNFYNSLNNIYLMFFLSFSAFLQLLLSVHLFIIHFVLVKKVTETHILTCLICET